MVSNVQSSSFSPVYPFKTIKVTSLGPSITAENQRNIKHFLTTVEVRNKNGEHVEINIFYFLYLY
jgi:hypothetical protein